MSSAKRIKNAIHGSLGGGRRPPEAGRNGRVEAPPRRENTRGGRARAGAASAESESRETDITREPDFSMPRKAASCAPPSGTAAPRGEQARRAAARLTPVPPVGAQALRGGRTTARARAGTGARIHGSSSGARGHRRGGGGPKTPRRSTGDPRNPGGGHQRRMGGRTTPGSRARDNAG